jgi:hypothetical protein
MASTPRLKNTLVFTALAAGASIALPHALSNGQRDLSPDIIFLPSELLEVTASDDAAVTVKNNGAVPISGALLVEAWHTIERAFGDVEDTDLPVKPYIVVSDAGGVIPASIRNPMSPPEAWRATAIEAGESDVMLPQVSANFAEVTMIRDGSVVGARARTVLPIAGGALTITPTKNGVALPALAIAFGAGASTLRSLAAPGAVPYVAGDRLGFRYDTDQNLAPVTTVEAWLEVYEEL